MNEQEEAPKNTPSVLQKAPLWVLIVPALISFIVVTLVAILFLTRG